MRYSTFIRNILFPNKYNPNSIGPIIEVEGIIKDDSFIAEKCNNVKIINFKEIPKI